MGVKLSELDPASPLSGDELIEAVQSGSSVKVVVSDIAKYKRLKLEFSSTIQLEIQHDMNCTDFQYSIINTGGIPVFAHIKAIDENKITVSFTDYEEGIITLIFFED